MAGTALHADQRGTTAAVGLHGPTRAAMASAQRLVERHAASENAGVNVPDATFTPSHRALVQVQRALREQARLTEPGRVLMGSWTGSLFADLHISGRHAAAAAHLSEVGRIPSGTQPPGPRQFYSAVGLPLRRTIHGRGGSS